MWDGRRVVALIPARGGSIRIPGKNLRKFAGRPLIDWTIETAKACPYFDSVVLSTDCPEIQGRGMDLGVDCPWLRPATLSDSSATMADVVLHALASFSNIEILVLLQPTSPLRTVRDITETLSLWKPGASSVSLSPLRQPTQWLYRLRKTGELLPFEDSRDSGECLALNGAVYVIDPEAFRKNPRFVDEKTRAYVMPLERSVDLDTEIDWQWGECLARGTA